MITATLFPVVPVEDLAVQSLSHTGDDYPPVGNGGLTTGKAGLLETQ